MSFCEQWWVDVQWFTRIWVSTKRSGVLTDVLVDGWIFTYNCLEMLIFCLILWNMPGFCHILQDYVEKYWAFAIFIKKYGNTGALQMSCCDFRLAWICTLTGGPPVDVHILEEEGPSSWICISTEMAPHSWYAHEWMGPFFMWIYPCRRLPPSWICIWVKPPSSICISW